MAHICIVERPAGLCRHKTKEAGSRIEPQTCARQLRAARQGKIRKGPAQNEIVLRLEESGNRVGARLAGKQHFLVPGLLFVAGDNLTRQTHSTAWAYRRRSPEWSGPGV